MRVGHIAYTYEPLIGGAEIYIHNLKKILNKYKITQHIYQGKNSPSQKNNSEIIFIPAPKLIKRKPLYSFNALLNSQFLQLLKEDKLIIHDPFHYWPVVWHRNTIVVSHGVRWERPQQEQRWYNRVHFLSAKLAFKFANTLVANDSDFLRKMGINIKPKEGMFQKVRKNSWFIPNCVDIDLFKKNKGIEHLKKLNPILVPRNIVRGRGIHLAISAFREFNKKYPDTNLVICGDFTDHRYKNEIFNQIVELGLLGKVYFIGSVSWEFMPNIYSSSLLTVIPTLYEEGTSLAALESMSCGTTVVSTNVGGLVDLPTVHCKPNVKDLSVAMIDTFKNVQKIAKNQKTETRTTYNLGNFEKAWLKVLEIK